MNGVSVAVRILKQLRHEKRTLILVLVAPLPCCRSYTTSSEIPVCRFSALTP